MKQGETYDILIVPRTLYGWKVVGENDNGYFIEKTSFFKCAKGKPYHHKSYIGKKSIQATKRCLI